MADTNTGLEMFSVAGKVAVVTGGTGVLGGAMARGLASAGAKVAIMGRRAEIAEQVANELIALGGEAIPLPADVLDLDQLHAAREILSEKWGKLDILVNVAGGNTPGAAIMGDITFFNMSQDAYESVVRLNLMGSVYPSQVFGSMLVEDGVGSIVNISSMTAERPLTRMLGYGNAKAAIDNFTRWLAVELIDKHGAGIRVNAIAPGFFIGEQNRDFLMQPDGTLNPRGQDIIDSTPMGRFGESDELVGALLWLCSDAARFVTGIVVPVDGGFSAFGGV